MNKLPEEIEQFVKDKEYTAEDIGMSGSEVRIYEDYVLKIQPGSREADNEYAISKWLRGRVPVPEIPVCCARGDTVYTLMTRVEGRMLCDGEYMADPGLIIRIAAQGLKSLWEVDVSRCPCDTSRLSNRLKAAEYNVEHGLVDVDNAEPDTFGPEGFSGPGELLDWLKENRPEEDLVLTHGDYCLPNIFVKDGKISGFIDIGKMGPADRWQDIAIAIRSLHHNFSGVYSGKKIFDFEPEMLLNELGMEMDGDKYRYYLLLDELF